MGTVTKNVVPLPSSLPSEALAEEGDSNQLFPPKVFSSRVTGLSPRIKQISLCPLSFRRGAKLDPTAPVTPVSSRPYGDFLGVLNTIYYL